MVNVCAIHSHCIAVYLHALMSHSEFLFFFCFASSYSSVKCVENAVTRALSAHSPKQHTHNTFDHDKVVYVVYLHITHKVQFIIHFSCFQVLRWAMASMFSSYFVMFNWIIYIEHKRPSYGQYFFFFFAYFSRVKIQCNCNMSHSSFQFPINATFSCWRPKKSTLLIMKSICWYEIRIFFFFLDFELIDDVLEKKKNHKTKNKTTIE